MRKMFLIAVVTLMSCNALVQSKKLPQTSVLKGRNGRHNFVLRLVRGTFRKQNHKITGSAPNQLIDGKPEFDSKTGRKNWEGTDGGLPFREFYSFNVIVDGKKWAIPSLLWQDCYNPRIDVEPNQWRDVWAWVSKDGKRLTVKMHGSDGAGSYAVLWHFRKSGRHSREIYSMV